MAASIRNDHRKSRRYGDPTPLRAYVRGIISRGIGAGPDATEYDKKRRNDATAWAARKGLGTWSHGLPTSRSA